MHTEFPNAAAFIDHLETLFDDAMADETAMEALSNALHMLQTAAAAREAGASGTLVAAALLHDIGHWVDGDTSLAEVPGVDSHHEDIGATYLAPFFGPEVCGPVKLHVAAKRYLCAAESEYFGHLSPGSVHSLELQGGPMSKEEMTLFESSPAHRDAVALRRWDEYGKIPDLDVPRFAAYRALLISLAT